MVFLLLLEVIALPYTLILFLASIFGWIFWTFFVAATVILVIKNPWMLHIAWRALNGVFRHLPYYLWRKLRFVSRAANVIRAIHDEEVSREQEEIQRQHLVQHQQQQQYNAYAIHDNSNENSHATYYNSHPIQSDAYTSQNDYTRHNPYTIHYQHVGNDDEYYTSPMNTTQSSQYDYNSTQAVNQEYLTSNRYSRDVNRQIHNDYPTQDTCQPFLAHLLGMHHPLTQQVIMPIYHYCQNVQLR